MSAVPDDYAPSTPHHSVQVAAVAALEAGLCPIPARTDGSKRPLIQWQQRQHQRPSRAEVDEWFADGHQAWGVVCGAVSGNLEMLELEGRAVDEGMWDAFCAAADRAGHRSCAA